MQLFTKLQEEYDQLWKYIIRPARTPYPETALGPETFSLEGITIKRCDFQLTNEKGYVFYCSHFIPLHLEQYPCVIYMHGNSSNRTQGMQYLGELIKNNISLCTFDFCGCGNAEGQYVTLGYFEWKETQEVFKYLRGKESVTQIGIWGRSMGAVTALRYLKVNPEIKVAVFDSPFKSLKHLVTDLVKKNSKIPGFILAGALKIISSTIQSKANFDIYDLNPVKDEAPYINTPGFFIVGEQDELIPVDHSKEIFSVYKSKKKQIRVVQGQHNTQRPDACIHDAIKFLKKYLIKKQKKPPAVETNKVQEVDFFGEFQNTQTKEEEEKTEEKVDFFADDIKFDKQFEQLQNIQQIEEKFKQLEKEQKGSFSFADIFSGAFMGKGKKQKKIQIIDGFNELRSRIQGVFSGEKVQQKEEKSEKLKKELKDYDSSFEKLLESEPEQYVWV